MHKKLNFLRVIKFANYKNLKKNIFFFKDFQKNKNKKV